MNKHPELPGRLTEEIGNRAEAWDLAGSKTAFKNDYLTVTLDRVSSPEGEIHERIVVRPRGAVGVVALDDNGRVLLVQQFRQALGLATVEIPAGVLDVRGESAMDAAARELAEEADIVAESWEPLLSLNPTPGFCSEHIQLFLARGLSPVPAAERTVREAEEAHMEQWWVDLDVATEAALSGRITDGKTIAGLLAAGR